jgi:hypothetical protein
MIKVIRLLNSPDGYRTLGSCCGHGVYHRTCILSHIDFLGRNIVTKEYYSGLDMPLKRNYYVTDKKTKMYYIPEVEDYYEALGKYREARKKGYKPKIIDTYNGEIIHGDRLQDVVKPFMRR